jgi:hypothetical protein
MKSLWERTASELHATITQIREAFPAVTNSQDMLGSALQQVGVLDSDVFFGHVPTMPWLPERSWYSELC